MAFENPIDLTALQAEVDDAAAKATDAIARANAAQSQADAAYALADGKINAFYTTGLPDAGSVGVGDLWYDGSKTRRALVDNASTLANWALVEDVDIDAAMQAASNAQSTADGKIVYFAPSPNASPPVAEGEGDIWPVSDRGNLRRRWNGTAWVDLKSSEDALGNILGNIITGSLVRTASSAARTEIGPNAIVGGTRGPTEIRFYASTDQFIDDPSGLVQLSGTQLRMDSRAQIHLGLAATNPDFLTIDSTQGITLDTATNLLLDAVGIVTIKGSDIRLQNGDVSLIGVRGNGVGRTLRRWDWQRSNYSFNASGDAVIPHDLGVTPTLVLINMNRLFTHHAHTFTATNFTLSIYTASTGSAPAAATRAVDWLAIQ